MKVKADRRRLPRRLVDDAQRHGFVRGGDDLHAPLCARRGGRGRRVQGREVVRHEARRPGADVHPRCRMRRVLDDHFAVRDAGLHLRVRGLPRRLVVVERGARGDHGPEVDGDLLELADRVERRARGQREAQLAPHAGTQRVLGEPRERQGVDGRALRFRREHQAAQRAVRVPDRQRVDPELLGRGLAPGAVPRLGAAPRLAPQAAHRVLFCGAREHGGRGGGQRRERARSPADAALLDAEAPVDRRRLARAVGVFDAVVRYVVAEVVAPDQRIRQPLLVAVGPVLDDVQQHDVRGGRAGEIDAHGRPVEQDDVGPARLAEQERDPEKGPSAVAGVEVRGGPQRLGQVGAAGVERGLQVNRREVGRRRDLHGAIISPRGRARERARRANRLRIEL